MTTNARRKLLKGIEGNRKDLGGRECGDMLREFANAAGAVVEHSQRVILIFAKGRASELFSMSAKLCAALIKHITFMINYSSRRNEHGNCGIERWSDRINERGYEVFNDIMGSLSFSRHFC